LSGIEELVIAGDAGVRRVRAVTVCAAAGLEVTLKLFVPPDNAALAGRTALASLELIATVSFV
jgi:hypothetical protein